MNPISLVRELTYDMNKTHQLPLIVNISLKALSLCHLGWWWYRKAKLIKQNSFAMAVGGITNWAAGHCGLPGQVLGGFAKLLLIITRLDECFHRLSSLSREYSQLKYCLTDRYPQIIKLKWTKSQASSLISPFTQNWWQSKKKKLSMFVNRITICVFLIFKQIGKLGMQLWDAYDSFFVSNDAMNELVVNGIKWMEKIKNNKEYFEDLLLENQKMIQKLLNCLHMSIDVDQFTEHMISVLNQFSNVVTVVQKCNEIGNGVIEDFTKRTVTHLAATFNALEMIPDSWLALDSPQWVQDALSIDQERFPSPDLIKVR